YDAAGNQIRIGAMNLTYDGEGRVAGATNTGSGVVTYDYDAADKRVRSTVSGVSTVYVYEASGELAAEYGVGSGTSGPEFLTGDHLGSVRLVTDGAGAVKQRRDYGPFGEELETASRTAILGYGTGGQRHRFTGKERDLETGLDYFGARYLASAQGRWTSPDAPFADHQLEDPQSWSLYGYVRNNPMKFIDTNGRAKVIFDGKDKTIKLFDKDGNQIGTWDAGNVVSSEVSLGRLVDGDYAFLDTKAPHTHGQEKDPNDKNPDSTKRILKDSENGPFGVYGIFRLKTFNAESDGESHSGVGLHSGRANKGCQAATLGCVRTGDAAMKKIKETAEGGDPLTVLTVQNNRTKADAQATKATSDAKASAGGDKKPSKVKKVAPNQ
ncbi:MAG: hypothetical protein NTW74_12330, partial [Acidobacteria bacterium]|nr:hypothetical protein [Acidobacteriota bacterium]